MVGLVHMCACTLVVASKSYVLATYRCDYLGGIGSSLRRIPYCIVLEARRHPMNIR
jgi:hypothetical protein